LAVVAWELLAGERPFRGDSPTAEAAAHVYAPVPSLCERHAHLPCELDGIFRKALAKEPDSRYATAAELVADLRAALAAAAATTQVLAPPAAVTRPPAPPATQTDPAPRSRPAAAKV